MHIFTTLRYIGISPAHNMMDAARQVLKKAASPRAREVGNESPGFSVCWARSPGWKLKPLLTFFQKITKGQILFENVLQKPGPGSPS